MTDDELISAYVDGRLSEAERSMLEARMAQDAVLRRRIAATRLLVHEARAIPARQLPRNFILPLDAGRKLRGPEPRRSSSSWVFRLGALAATVIFVSLVLVELLGTAGTPTAPMSAPASAETMAQSESPALAQPAARMAPMVAATEAGAASGQYESPPADSMHAAAAPEVEAAPPPGQAPQALAAPAATPTPSPLPPTEPVVRLTPLLAAIALLIAIVLGLLGWAKR